METVTLAKGGTAERVVKVEEIQIPDLWHVAMLFRDAQRTYEQQQKVANEQKLDKDYPIDLNAVTITIQGFQAEQAADAILETWHLCEDLRRASYRQMEEPSRL